MKLFVCILVLLIGCTGENLTPDSDNQTTGALDIIVSAQTDRTIAALDETIRFTLSAAYPPQVKLLLPEVGDQIAGLRIVDFGERGPRLIDNRLVVEKWFDLHGDLSGAYIIPAMAVRVTERNKEREIITPQIFLKVGAENSRSDNETMRDIIDIKPPVALARDVLSIIIGCVITLALLLAGTGFLLYSRKRRALAAQPLKPAHELAYEQLERLEREGWVQRGMVQKYYFVLSDIFRQYLQNRFAIHAIELTTQELLRFIKELPDIPSSVKENIRVFLLQADLVKFAKYHPEEQDIQKSLLQVRDSIEQTRQESHIVEHQHRAESTSGQEERR